MRIVLKVEYDGTDFCGWQVQPDGVSVQGVIEDAVQNLTGEKISVIGSGRTDSGVHAAGQVAHFDVSADRIPPEKYACALNAFLPSGVKILESGLAKDGFHARFSAKRKTYGYRLYVSPCIRPLKDRYAVDIRYDADVGRMNEACAYLVGRHDFRCFLASNSSVKDTVREIYSAEVSRSGDDILFTVSGNGFLYNMVRIIVGTLLKVGVGELAPSDMKNILNGGRRELAGKTMPARGLTLLSVEYE